MVSGIGSSRETAECITIPVTTVEPTHVAMAITAKPMSEASSTRRPSCSRMGMRILTMTLSHHTAARVERAPAWSGRGGRRGYPIPCGGAVVGSEWSRRKKATGAVKGGSQTGSDDQVEMGWRNAAEGMAKAHGKRRNKGIKRVLVASYMHSTRYIHTWYMGSAPDGNRTRCLRQPLAAGACGRSACHVGQESASNPPAIRNGASLADKTRRQTDSDKPAMF